MDAALKADLLAVSTARVYFGHQSVGRNILDGILLHSRVGRNEQPATKCEDFRRILDQELRGNVDVALFKFCYVDFSDTSDVSAIFDVYARTLDELKRRYPKIVFVHVTAPLRTVDRGPGVWIRERLGRRNRGKHANVRRGLLTKRYSADPVFDLAASMSTHPDGRRESFRMNGAAWHALVPDYTDDGGHLHAAGRTHVAAAFVRAIAAAVRGRQRAAA